MRIAGLAMNDVWAHRVLRQHGVETVRVEGKPAEIGVFVESVDLVHHGPEQHYRPYLHIVGEMRSVRPDKALPYRVKEVTFPPGGGETVDAFYEFDDEQLTRLTQKGYFNTGFVVPGKVTGVEWELPAIVDTLVLAPTGLADGVGETNVPVVFVKVHNLGNLTIDFESSKYDLVDYFEDYLKTGADRAEQTLDNRGLRASSDTINPLFSNDDLDAADCPDTTATPIKRTSSTHDDLDARLQDAAAALADEEAQVRAELEQIAGTPENLYRQRVASFFEIAPTKRSTPVSRAPADEHELHLGAGLGVEPMKTGTTFEETKDRVAERAADLDHGEDDGERQY